MAERRLIVASQSAIISLQDILSSSPARQAGRHHYAISPYYKPSRHARETEEAGDARYYLLRRCVERDVAALSTYTLMRVSRCQEFKNDASARIILPPPVVVVGRHISRHQQIARSYRRLALRTARRSLHTSPHRIISLLVYMRLSHAKNNTENFRKETLQQHVRSYGRQHTILGQYVTNSDI